VKFEMNLFQNCRPI